jgi:bis(5'-nucleosyl)-tetraphosphatase (symmetrical)
MSTYVVGDIHGCARTFDQLIERIQFEPHRDRLWLVGDLVNRGPGSLEVLRTVKEMGEGVITVLGNHDLHLLGCWFGVTPRKSKDTLNAILTAEDRDDLMQWLRQRPLLHCENRHVLVHAGLLPPWTVAEALEYSRETEQILRGPEAAVLLKSLGEKKAPIWNGHLSGMLRYATILRGLTQLRTIAPDGSMCLDFVGPLEEVPPGCTPWFAVPPRKSESFTFFFGHWAALGLYRAPGIFGLDTSCVRGGPLTAVRIDDGALFKQPNVERI